MRLTFCVLLAFSTFCRADTVRLTSGQEIHGAVTKYARGTFELRLDNGSSASYSANKVKQIQFDPRSTPSKLMTRNKGAQEGAITAFENGGFVMTQAAGARTFPVIFVERAELVTDRGQGIELITRGQSVQISQHLALGNVTVVDFYADWCGPCKQLAPMIEKLAQDPEIAIRKIDIVNWQSPVAQQFHVEGIPRVDVYDRKGRLVGAVEGVDPQTVLNYVAKAKSSQ